MYRENRHYNAYILSLSLLSLLGGARGGLFAQERVAHTSQCMKAYASSYTQVPFSSNTDISAGSLLPASPFVCGMDVAWDSEDNVVRGTNYIGTDVMQVGRISFQPSDLVDSDGNLSTAQQSALQSRLNHIALSGVKDVILNCDHEALNSTNYYGKPEEWYKVIKASVLYARSKGFNVITISPFNEPDYTSWGEGTQAHFKEIARLISEDTDLSGIRISAGNTLNCDEASSWYSYMKPYVTEGNTHQLAGTFDSYASFWQTVRADGNHATADEMHNVGEAFIGVHYGLQSGVWWGWDGAARGEYCRAAYYGKEIAYAENRTAWSAASVYKRQDGRMDAFLGVSERQASTSYYEFVATDREVYYDGYGPVRNFGMKMPGGSGYATDDQKNAERMVQIQYGEDVPVEALSSATSYVIMNRATSMCMGYYLGNKDNGTALAQTKYTSTKSNTHQQWLLRPVGDQIGGDFGYYYLKSVRDTTHLADLLNWSTAAGGTLCGYQGAGGSNEQWFFEYAGDGFWYIRSRHSGLYIEPKATNNNSSLQQSAYSGAAKQQWRFIPVDAALEQTAPKAPIGLTVTAQTASARLDWQANTESDLAGYMVYRGEIAGLADTLWTCVGRLVADAAFVDNGICPEGDYCYRLRAVDKSRNLSEASQTVSFHFSPKSGLVAHYSFEDHLQDSTANCFDAVCAYTVPYNTTAAKRGEKGLYLNAQTIQLPATVADSRCLTFAAWVNNTQTGSGWQRIFDFGNGEGQYLFLTPNNGSEMRFVMKNLGDEEILSATKLGTGWHHVAVTIGDEAVTLYVDGTAVATSTAMQIRPSDIRPLYNYIGRSQYKADPSFRGYVDDVRIYNIALSADDVQLVMNGSEALASLSSPAIISAPSSSYRLDGTLSNGCQQGLLIRNGRLVFQK